MNNLLLTPSVRRMQKSSCKSRFQMALRILLPGILMTKASTRQRQAYMLYVQTEKLRRGQDAGSSSEVPGMLKACDNNFWKRIWYIPSPNKIKMFTWRIAHNSLALCTNLRRRGVQLEDCKCLFCGRVDEDAAHLFVKCKSVKEVWRQSGMEAIRIRLESAETVTMALDILWELKEKERVQILTAWWHWWNNRNKLREGELPVSAHEIVRRSISQSDEYFQLFSKKHRKQDKDGERWCLPTDGVLDASYIPGENYASWGVVVRDCKGELVAASAGKTAGISDVYSAELQAMQRAMDIAADIGAIRAVF